MATTIKVSSELRDRLAQRAAREGGTLADAIEHSLEVAEEAEFWRSVRATMGSDSAQRILARDTEELAGTLRDGLDREDWSDVL